MSATTLTWQELDALVEDIATRVYGPLDPDDGYAWLDPIYAWVEPLLANGVAPNAADLADAWVFLCEQDAIDADR